MEAHIVEQLPNVPRRYFLSEEKVRAKVSVIWLHTDTLKICSVQSALRHRYLCYEPCQ
jgi:hypothetical protein